VGFIKPLYSGGGGMEKMKTYQRYVEQEDSYNKQLATLEQCQHAIVDHIYRYGESSMRHFAGTGGRVK